MRGTALGRAPRKKIISRLCFGGKHQGWVLEQLQPVTWQGGVGLNSTLIAFQSGSNKVGPEWRQTARRRPKRPGARPARRCAPPLRRQGFKGGLFGIHTCCIHYQTTSAPRCAQDWAPNGGGGGARPPQRCPRRRCNALSARGVTRNSS